VERLNRDRTEALSLLGGQMMDVKAEWIAKRVARYIVTKVPDALAERTRDVTAIGAQVVYRFHRDGPLDTGRSAVLWFTQLASYSEPTLRASAGTAEVGTAEVTVPMSRARFKAYLLVAHHVIRHLTE
jgi:hypothetical protein